jgi:hypothetical protein
MAIPRGHQFAIKFDNAFPQGLVLIGDVTPDNEYQTREDKAAGRPVRQKIDNATGKRQWKATVTDPDEPHAKRASFEITFIADVQPVPTTTEVLPGMRPIELDGLTAEPRVAGTANSNTSPTSTGRPASPPRRVLPGVGYRSRSSRPAACSSPARPREPHNEYWRYRTSSGH